MRKFKFNKKYIPAFILAAACLVVAILCVMKAVDGIKYNEELSQSSIIDIKQITLTADGGNGDEIPKNTSFAIDDLRSKGFTSIKIDARLTADKKWVALADEDISSVTNGFGNVSEYKYYQLMNYNLKNTPASSPAVIELVTDVAQYAFSNSFTPIIYIHNYSKSAIRTLIEEVSALSPQVFYIASSDTRIIEYANKVSAAQLCFYYTDKITEESIDFCKNNASVTLCFNAKNNSRKDVEMLLSEEIPYACYGAETLREIEKFYKLGIRHFINDSVEIGVSQ
ncbi:MAG: hypothetical protein IJ279_01360 [Clostridia bacterium]|nr:hypothetical protein [Clostridia bacterium]